MYGLTIKIIMYIYVYIIVIIIMILDMFNLRLYSFKLYKIEYKRLLC